MLSLAFIQESQIQCFENGNKALLSLIYNDDEPSFNYDSNKETIKKLYEESESHATIVRINDALSRCMNDDAKDEDLLEVIKSIKDISTVMYTQIIIAIHGLLQVKNLNDCNKFMNEIKTITSIEIDSIPHNDSCDCCDEDDTNEVPIDVENQADIYENIEKTNTLIDIENEEE